MSLKDKVVAISGAAGGLGPTVARAFSDAGVHRDPRHAEREGTFPEEIAAAIHGAGIARPGRAAGR